MSFSQPDHTNYNTTTISDTFYATPYHPYASYVQPLALPYSTPQPPVQYAIPVPAAPSLLDYLRPQAWRNMPQQQERSSTTSNPSLDSSAQSSAYSEVAVVAADASVVAVADASVVAVADAVAPIEASSTMDESVAASSGAPPIAIRSTVDTAVETMWEARRKREEAEAEADRKLLDAVCKASLAEYNERERALKTFASETSQQTLEHETSSVALQQAKGEAEQRKRAAMQVVIDSKARAKQMSERARDATSLYEQKTNERLVKQAELETLKLREVQEAEMHEMQQRKQEAMLKRSEAEQKAREARDKAEAMRCRAFQAVSTVRANTRRQIETQLNEEEAQRQREMQRKLEEIGRARELAHQRREAAAKKAEDARRRADELRLRAEQARAGLKSSTAAASSFLA